MHKLWWLLVLDLVGASFYSILELIWTWIIDGVAFTSIQQFTMNLLTIPLFTVMYRLCIPKKYLRIGLYPLNIWILEILQGYSLMHFYDGRNPAWNYTTSDAFFDGNIRLFYFPVWLFLGVVVDSILDWIPYFNPSKNRKLI